MSHEWRKKKTRFRVPSDSMLGAIVFSGIALVVAIVILGKGGNDIPNEATISPQTIRVIDGDTIEVNFEICARSRIK